MIFVLVPGIGRLERIGAGIDLEDEADHIRQRRLVDARALVDAVAGVEAHLFGWNAAQPFIDRPDIYFARAPRAASH